MMKKFSTMLLAAAFIMSAGMSFAASNSTDFLKNYQNKRDAAIKKQDAKLQEIQKKQEAAQKKREADRAALLKKQEEYKKQQQAKKMPTKRNRNKEKRLLKI